MPRNFFIDSDYDIIDLKDGQFLPISAAARLKIFGVLSGGADVGYAVGISDAATWGNFNVGFLFQF